MAWPSYPAPPGSITSCESDSLLIKEKEEASDCDLQRGDHLTERNFFYRLFFLSLFTTMETSSFSKESSIKSLAGSKLLFSGNGPFPPESDPWPLAHAHPTSQTSYREEEESPVLELNMKFPHPSKPGEFFFDVMNSAK